jgi:hypothetical protein
MQKVFRLVCGARMARSYATLLGCLGFALVLIRGVLRAGDPSATLLHAWLALVAFAALGLLGGLMTDHVLRESLPQHGAAAGAEADVAARTRQHR